MNCRPGDLAVVSGSGIKTPGLRGRFVIVERLGVDGELVAGVRQKSGGAPFWICRSAASGANLPFVLDYTSGSHLGEMAHRGIDDRLLRPIRPNEGEDESLSWAKPQIKEPA